MDRRQLITGLISLITAPAIVRAGSLMSIKGEPLLPRRTYLPWMQETPAWDIFYYMDPPWEFKTAPGRFKSIDCGPIIIEVENRMAG